MFHPIQTDGAAICKAGWQVDVTGCAMAHKVHRLSTSRDLRA